MTALTRVSVRACSSYDTGLDEALQALLNDLGGMASFVRPGQSVLIKPNLLTARTPEQAVTTHPALLRAIIRQVKAAGGSPSVADSPSNVTRLEELWTKTGCRAVCDEEHTPLINLEKAGSRRYDLGRFSFSIAQPVLDADVVINVPKVKTHMLTVFTGAVKNLYGTIPGFQKTSLHKEYPNAMDFGELLAAIYSVVKPALSIADGVVGMEGDGPSAGRPIHLGILAGSSDAAALDAALCRLLNIRGSDVSYLAVLERQFPGLIDAARVEWCGDSPADLHLPPFRAPSTLPGRLIPGRLVRAIGRWLWIRPAFLDCCVSCGLCVKSCPVNALNLPPGKRPVLTESLCIGCCCCHEVCPAKAVRMTPSPLLSILRRGKLP